MCIDFHREEAKKMWEKRESEWEVERVARKKLMEGVIAIQKKQVRHRFLYKSFEPLLPMVLIPLD